MSPSSTEEERGRKFLRMTARALSPLSLVSGVHCRTYRHQDSSFSWPSERFGESISPLDIDNITFGGAEQPSFLCH